MKEYIERDAALKNQRYNFGFDELIVFVRDIEAIPVADVQEVKHAYWVNGICTNCGIGKPVVKVYSGTNEVVYQYQGELNYCPNCGAKMDLEE